MVVPSKNFAFKSKNAQGLLAEQKGYEYSGTSEIKESIVKKLNAEFPTSDKPFLLTQTPQYFVLRCKFKSCTFQQWFRYKENSNKGIIEYFRTIN